MTDNVVRVATYWSSFDAETAKLHLDRCGIPAIVTSGAMNAMMGEMGGTLSPIELLVREEDRERTVLALDEFLSQAGADDWECKCSESVPGSFAICWSCGGDRATHAVPVVKETVEPQSSIAMEVTEETFVDKNHTIRKTDPGSLSSPYAPPSSVSSASRLLKKESITLEHASNTELEAMVDRAWRAAIIGFLLPPVLHFYSLYLLFQTCRSTEPLSRVHQRKFAFSLLINFFVIVVCAFVGMAVLAG